MEKLLSGSLSKTAYILIEMGFAKPFYTLNVLQEFERLLIHKEELNSLAFFFFSSYLSEVIVLSI